MYKNILLIVILFISTASNAQHNDTLTKEECDWLEKGRMEVAEMKRISKTGFNDSSSSKDADTISAAFLVSEIKRDSLYIVRGYVVKKYRPFGITSELYIDEALKPIPDKLVVWQRKLLYKY